MDGKVLNLEIKPDEVDLLKKILENHLADLRMEISNTDDFEYRESLKRDEALLKGMIARIR